MTHFADWKELISRFSDIGLVYTRKIQENGWYETSTGRFFLAKVDHSSFKSLVFILNVFKVTLVASCAMYLILEIEKNFVSASSGLVYTGKMRISTSPFFDLSNEKPPSAYSSSYSFLLLFFRFSKGVSKLGILFVLGEFKFPISF